jgi:hypothetical protein
VKRIRISLEEQELGEYLTIDGASLDSYNQATTVAGLKTNYESQRDHMTLLTTIACDSKDAFASLDLFILPQFFSSSLLTTSTTQNPTTPSLSPTRKHPQTTPSTTPSASLSAQTV